MNPPFFPFFISALFFPAAGYAFFPINAVIPVVLFFISIALFLAEGNKPAGFKQFFFIDFSNPAKLAVDSVFLFILTIAMLSALATALAFFNAYDAATVAQAVSRQPPLVLVAAVLIAPVSEELLFRGYLLRKTGVLVSSILFALSHVFWSAWSELAAAFAVGLLFAWFVEKNKNIVPCILVHAAYNFLSIYSIIYFSQALP